MVKFCVDRRLAEPWKRIDPISMQVQLNALTAMFLPIFPLAQIIPAPPAQQQLIIQPEAPAPENELDLPPQPSSSPLTTVTMPQQVRVLPG